VAAMVIKQWIPRGERVWTRVQVRITSSATSSTWESPSSANPWEIWALPQWGKD
jgi:hypothetical protein